MRQLTCMVLALASLACPIPASAQSKSMQRRVSACFLQSLKDLQIRLDKVRQILDALLRQQILPVRD